MGHYSMRNFIHDVGHITKPIHKDVVGLVNGAGKTFNHVVDSQASIANNLIHTGGSILSSLSLPLAINKIKSSPKCVPFDLYIKRWNELKTKETYTKKHSIPNKK